ncbi:hypothetical protein QTP88_003447 [Uroleucon formosanum]
MNRTMTFNVFFTTTVLCLTALSLSVEAVELTQLNDNCLRCICEAIGNCSNSTKCSGEVCGMFGITWPYWFDSGRPVVPGSDPDDSDAYSKCANDATCAQQSVMAYMQRFALDCNNDGKINCYDYAAIHKLGRFGCKRPLDDEYRSRYMSCQLIFKD